MASEGEIAVAIIAVLGTGVSAYFAYRASAGASRATTAGQVLEALQREATAAREAEVMARDDAVASRKLVARLASVVMILVDDTWRMRDLLRDNQIHAPRMSPSLRAFLDESGDDLVGIVNLQDAVDG